MKLLTNKHCSVINFIIYLVLSSNQTKRNVQRQRVIYCPKRMNKNKIVRETRYYYRNYNVTL